jgi:hypothetical protein
VKARNMPDGAFIARHACHQGGCALLLSALNKGQCHLCSIALEVRETMIQLKGLYSLVSVDPSRGKPHMACATKRLCKLGGADQES